ncbi:ATP-binding protein [Desulfatiferula olefinivorans]
MKQLPIGISTFEQIRSKDCYYVDKTPFIKQLHDQGKYYFLSRPRRFGKSLFIDTLKEAFAGNKALFKGLYLENHWNWDETHTVVLISFGGGVIKDLEDLEIKLNYILENNAEKYSIHLKYSTIREKFSELIQKLYEKSKRKVVILVDEYDKPILDNILDTANASKLREGLKNIYSVIKDSDAYVEFAFLAGVSKFAKVSLFSGLNNLEDLTLNPDFSSMCGYSQNELETIFIDRLDGIDLNELKKWYNGYNFLGDPVYNPFDVLLFFREKKYKNYWFETATPGFLIELLYGKKYFIPTLNSMEVSEEILGSFDVDHIYVETLMFQTGYLTIKKESRLGNILRYQLVFPNLEVRSSFNNYILNYFVSDVVFKNNNQSHLYERLLANDVAALEQIFHAFYASIPNDWYRKNTIANYEGYYASIFYCYFAALGLDVTPEDTTNHGRIDLTLAFEGRVYIFEFKVIELDTGTTSALDQIRSKRYYEKYTGDFTDIYLIGVEFSRDTRNIERFDWEKLSC